MTEIEVEKTIDEIMKIMKEAAAIQALFNRNIEKLAEIVIDQKAQIKRLEILAGMIN